MYSIRTQHLLRHGLSPFSPFCRAVFKLTWSCKNLTQPPDLMTPGASKLQPRGVSDSCNQWLDLSPLGAQQGLHKRLSAGAIPPQNDLDAGPTVGLAGTGQAGDCLGGAVGHLLAAGAPLLLGHLAEEVRGELVRGVVGAALGLAQPDVARGHRQDRVAARLRERQVHVVPVRVHVQVVRLRAGHLLLLLCVVCVPLPVLRLLLL